MKRCACCPTVWFSGFFAMGFFVHVLRLIFQVPVKIAGYDVPLLLSGFLMVIFGLLTWWFLYLGRSRCHCGKS